VIIFMDMCVVITVAMVWPLFVPKALWTLWDNITFAMAMRLKIEKEVKLSCRRQGERSIALTHS
jgi:hypothetical protein